VLQGFYALYFAHLIGENTYNTVFNALADVMDPEMDSKETRSKHLEKVVGAVHTDLGFESHFSEQENNVSAREDHDPDGDRRSIDSAGVEEDPDDWASERTDEHTEQ
jgi:hypothetical protein